MLEKILQDAHFVHEHSQDVVIHEDVIDTFVKDFVPGEFWLKSNPFHVLDMSLRDLISFLLVYHTIGDYCFWGDPKWMIQTEDGVLDGSFAIMKLVIQEFQERGNFNLTLDEFQDLLKGNVEIPLLKERYEQLQILNTYLQNHSFYDEIADFNDDVTLFSYLIDYFPYFKDESTYEGRTISFYKRAQLLTSDILHVKEMKGIPVDYTHLVGCADYKIPQVMNSYGMMTYSDSLDRMIAAKTEIPEGDAYEVEIRANTLAVIDSIYQKLNGKVPRMDINDSIWLLGQNKQKVKKLYHCTKTTHY